MVDTESKLAKILKLLIQQTKSGKLSWKESYRNSFQATLSNQTVVVRSNAIPGLATPILEIRDSKGEVIQQIGSDQVSDMLLSNPNMDLNPRMQLDSALVHKVEELAKLLESRQDFKLNVTLDSMLKELEEN